MRHNGPCKDCLAQNCDATFEEQKMTLWGLRFFTTLPVHELCFSKHTGDVSEVDGPVHITSLCCVPECVAHKGLCSCGLPSTVLTGYFGSPARQSASTGSTKPTQRLPRTKATRKFGLKKQREGVCVSWLHHNKKTRPCIPDASERPMDTHSLQSCLGRKKCEKTQRKQLLGHVMGSSMRSAKKKT